MFSERQGSRTEEKLERVHCILNTGCLGALHVFLLENLSADVLAVVHVLIILVHTERQNSLPEAIWLVTCRYFQACL